VSPVIAVILMVAITVLLVTAIASFVLGVGQEAGQTAPDASFTFDYLNGTAAGSYDGDLTVRHDSGDPVVATELYLRGDGFSEASANQTWAGYAAENNATITGTDEGTSAVIAGDRVDLLADSDYEISVVWESLEGDSSATLADGSGPAA